MIIQTACTSFKVGLLNGNFNFGTGTAQTYYIALYTSLANLGATTTAYTSTNEIVGSGYTAGGKPLTISQVPTSSSNSTTAFLSFAPVVWTGASFVANGALIYLNGTAGGVTNPAVCTLDFGSAKVSTSAGTFTVTFPTATATTAIIQIQ